MRRKRFRRRRLGALFVIAACLIVAVMMLAAYQGGRPDQPNSSSLPSSSHGESTESSVGSVSQVVPPTPTINRDRLKRDLEALTFERFTAQARQRTRDYIEAELTRAGWSFVEQDYGTGVNVIAKPAPDADAAPQFLVGAHYDSLRGTPGADDNITGVAVTLELARTLSDRVSSRPKTSNNAPDTSTPLTANSSAVLPKNLTLVFFDEEEKWALGSGAYTDDAANLSQLEGAIVLEMLGYTCTQPGCQTVPDKFPVDPPSETGNFLAIVGDLEHPYLVDAFEHQKNQTQYPLLTLNVPFKGLMTPAVLSSDHVPFWFKGAGAAMVTDTAYLRNPHYHRASDTLNTIDLDFLHNSGQIVMNAVWTLLHQNLEIVN